MPSTVRLATQAQYESSKETDQHEQAPPCPTTMNITYCRNRPVCTPRSQHAQAVHVQRRTAFTEPSTTMRSAKPVPDRGETAREPRRAVDQPSIQRRSMAAAKPAMTWHRTDEQEVVQLVEPPLVQQELVDRLELPAHFGGLDQ